MELKTIQTARVPVQYYEGGQGAPLVFLHGANGLDLEQGFLNSLAERFHVFAPLVPGYGESEECTELRDMLDFTLHTWDVIEALGVKNPILVGFSMGGMIAGEMAAIAPHDVSRLALIAPAGIWLDDHPMPDLFSLMPFELPKVLFYDQEAGSKAMTGDKDTSDPAFLQAFLVRNARQLGAAGKILFPIPDRGLSSRLYRIQAKTLLIWGENDQLISPVYAQAFQRGIAATDTVMIPQAGHVVTFERPREVIGALARLM